MVDMEQFKEDWRKRRINRASGNGHIWTGIFILLIGLAALLRNSVEDMPEWFFSWKTLLIAMGLFIGVRHGFRGIAWLILIMVGGVFLLNDIYPDMTLRNYVWPLILIVIGLFFIFRPRKRWYADGKKKELTGDAPNDPLLNPEETYSKEDFVDATSIFGGTKKNILSKDFKGGDIVNIFGGSELNLSQADIKHEAVLELTTIFGGTKLIIPSNWSVRSEAVTLFGSIEDKRPVPQLTESTDKTLVLRGTVIFGGIDIKSF